MVPGPLGLRRRFRTLKDPRRVNSCEHLLLDIIAICAVVANADDWQGVETFGHERHDWLKTFLELPNGIPSHDTFERVFDALDPPGQDGSTEELADPGDRVTGGAIGLTGAALFWPGGI